MNVLLVCAKFYNGHELWTTLGVLQEQGHTFEVASTELVIADEITFSGNRVERTIYDIPNIDEFDAIMFVSGNMQYTEAHWDNEKILSFVDEARERDIPIAAICCSVPIIRKAAKGKKVSFFPLLRSAERLEREGAILQTVSLTADGKLVTAEHQMMTQMWAESFCLVMDGKDGDPGLEDSGFQPGGWERKPDPDIEHMKDIARKTGKRGFDE